MQEHQAHVVTPTASINQSGPSTILPTLPNVVEVLTLTHLYRDPARFSARLEG